MNPSRADRPNPSAFHLPACPLWHVLAVAGFLLITGCNLTFNAINQPSAVPTNTVVNVSVSVAYEDSNGDDYTVYFGVKLPDGWTVVGDAVPFSGGVSGTNFYNADASAQMEVVEPAGPGYTWWVGACTESSTGYGQAVGQLRLQTAGPVGAYWLDYMLGDNNDGFNQTRSNGHALALYGDNRPPVITTTSPRLGSFVTHVETGATFQVEAVDPEGSNLTYTWSWDGAPVGGNTNAYSRPSFADDAGDHVLLCDVADDFWTDASPAQWNVSVRPPPLRVTTTHLPDATEMEPYNAELFATNVVYSYCNWWDVSGQYREEPEDNSDVETGRPQGWQGRDETWSLALPFAFPFYGKTYRSCWVDSSGRIRFSGGAPTDNPDDGPFRAAACIAALWGTIETTAPGDIYVHTNATAVTIEWRGGYRYNQPDRVNASAELHANGSIRLRFGPGNQHGGLIGVSAGDGVRFTSRWSNNQEGADDLVYLYQPEAMPAGLSLMSMGTGTITGTPLLAGEYTITVRVQDMDMGIAYATAFQTLGLRVLANTNRPPVILSASPAGPAVTLIESTNQLFAVTASDPEHALLSYLWTRDGVAISNDLPAYDLATTWGDAGSFDLAVTLSDGLWSNVATNWRVTITDDNDGDGIPNAYERAHGLNPWRAADATNDFDGDGLSNFREYQFGTENGNPDTDGDTLPDGWEADYGSDPRTPRGGLSDLDVQRVGHWAALNTPAMAANLSDLVVGTSHVYAVGQFINYETGYSTGCLYSIDFSNPTNPVTAGLAGLPGEGRTVEAISNVVYVGIGWPDSGLAVVDCTDPTRPALHGVVANGSSIYGVGVGSLLLASGNRIELCDTTDLLNPVVSASSYLGGMGDAWAYDVAHAGSFAYLAESVSASPVAAATRVDAFEIGSEPSLTFRGSAQSDPGTYFYPPRVALSGTNLFVSLLDVGVGRFDISDPAQPSYAGVIGGDEVQGLCVDSNLLITVGRPSLRVWRVDGPDATPVFRYDLNQSAKAVRTAGRFIFVLTWNGIDLFENRGLQDVDQDGMADRWEVETFGSTNRDGTADFDDDGLTDAAEYRAGLNPTAPDQDYDGLRDGDEVFLHHTDPRLADTDGDEVRDGEEVTAGADGFLTDPTHVDTDGDRVSDLTEPDLGRNPTVAEPAYLTVFSDDMEHGPANWVADTPWSLGHGDYASPYSSWHGTNSDWRVYATLTLAPSLDLRNYRHAWLSFRHRLDFYGSAWVELSTDNGATWQQEEYLGFNPDGSPWQTMTLGISHVCGNSGVRFRFVLNSWGDSDKTPRDGWFLDDIQVYAVNGDIAGAVKGSGAPLEDALVLLAPRFAAGEGFQDAEFTDNMGAYRFDMLVPGRYVMQADAAGFAAEFFDHASRRDQATAVDLAYGEHRVVSFNLRSGQAPARIEVQSNPSGAGVLLDFQPTGGVTPLVLDNVTPGSHFVSLIPAGPFPLAAPRAVNAWEGRSVLVEFERNTPSGSLRVVSDPVSNAQVFVDYQPTGLLTPAVVTNLAVTPPGTHHISISKAGLASPEPQQVQVSDWETNTVTFTLPASASGALRVSSIPTGAVVYVDYRSVGRETDVLLSDVAVGSHFVSLVLPGFASPPVQGVPVAAGQTARAHFALQANDQTDADGDGVPDAWERAVGLNATPGEGNQGNQAPGGDADHDGLTNEEELLAGTSPIDPNSVFEVNKMPRTAGGDTFTFNWASVPGKLYRVEGCDDLFTGIWNDLSGVVEATGDSCTFVEDLTQRPLARYYRIVVLPGP